MRRRTISSVAHPLRRREAPARRRATAARGLAALFHHMVQPDEPPAGIHCPSPPGGPDTGGSQSAAPVLQPLLWLAAPMLLGQAGQVLLQLTDTVMIGHVGPVPLSQSEGASISALGLARTVPSASYFSNISP